jgi:mRNA-degrading endonuclease RelE of RelBE toxin-antitoxin system
MVKLEDIEAAVEKLSPEELKRFRAWLDELEERLFDERIERDAKAGKLDAVEAKARENHRAERFRDL